jgi:hypothetical protein
MTLSENVKHAYSTGLSSSKGSKNNNAKLTELYAQAIVVSHLSNRELAFLFDVDITTIQKVRRGKLWSNSDEKLTKSHE